MFFCLKKLHKKVDFSGIFFGKSEGGHKKSRAAARGRGERDFSGRVPRQKLGPLALKKKKKTPKSKTRHLVSPVAPHQPSGANDNPDHQDFPPRRPHLRQWGASRTHFSTLR